jgi:hypothetical protein
MRGGSALCSLLFYPAVVGIAVLHVAPEKSTLGTNDRVIVIHCGDLDASALECGLLRRVVGIGRVQQVLLGNKLNVAPR